MSLNRGGSEDERDRQKEAYARRLRSLIALSTQSKTAETDSLIDYISTQMTESTNFESYLYYESRRKVSSECQSKGRVPSKSQSKERVPSKSQSKERVSSKSQSKERVPSESRSKRPSSKSRSKKRLSSKSQSKERLSSKYQSKERDPRKSQSKRPSSKSRSKKRLSSKSQSKERVSSSSASRETIGSSNATSISHSASRERTNSSNFASNLHSASRKRDSSKSCSVDNDDFHEIRPQKSPKLSNFAWRESPVPDLIIEIVDPGNKHDEPPEFYRRLLKKAMKFYRRVVVEGEDVSDVSTDETVASNVATPIIGGHTEPYIREAAAAKALLSGHTKTSFSPRNIDASPRPLLLNREITLRPYSDIDIETFSRPLRLDNEAILLPIRIKEASFRPLCNIASAHRPLLSLNKDASSTNFPVNLEASQMPASTNKELSSRPISLSKEVSLTLLPNPNKEVLLRPCPDVNVEASRSTSGLNTEAFPSSLPFNIEPFRSPLSDLNKEALNSSPFNQKASSEPPPVYHASSKPLPNLREVSSEPFPDLLERDRRSENEVSFSAVRQSTPLIMDTRTDDDTSDSSEPQYTVITFRADVHAIRTTEVHRRRTTEEQSVENVGHSGSDENNVPETCYTASTEEIEEMRRDPPRRATTSFGNEPYNQRNKDDNRDYIRSHRATLERASTENIRDAMENMNLETDFDQGHGFDNHGAIYSDHGHIVSDQSPSHVERSPSHGERSPSRSDHTRSHEDHTHSDHFSGGGNHTPDHGDHTSGHSNLDPDHGDLVYGHGDHTPSYSDQATASRKRRLTSQSSGLEPKRAKLLSKENSDITSSISYAGSRSAYVREASNVRGSDPRTTVRLIRERQWNVRSTAESIQDCASVARSTNIEPSECGSDLRSVNFGSGEEREPGSQSTTAGLTQDFDALNMKAGSTQDPEQGVGSVTVSTQDREQRARNAAVSTLDWEHKARSATVLTQDRLQRARNATVLTQDRLQRARNATVLTQDRLQRARNATVLTQDYIRHDQTVTVSTQDREKRALSPKIGSNLPKPNAPNATSSTQNRERERNANEEASQRESFPQSANANPSQNDQGSRNTNARSYENIFYNMRFVGRQIVVKNCHCDCCPLTARMFSGTR